MGEGRRQKGVRESSGVCFILCDFDMQLMPKRKREREREQTRDKNIFTSQRVFSIRNHNLAKAESVIHTPIQREMGGSLTSLLDYQSMYASIS